MREPTLALESKATTANGQRRAKSKSAGDACQEASDARPPSEWIASTRE
ncbi:hypothetical protein [Polynucleobacter sp. MWH-Adler-W8]|nr:hypothetical protein [Polynucleobacter sp. MWH-Adler-W8]